ncbi:ParA family protein [Halobacterium sp. KA-4]|uniref:ParA family protein n=1 Tax=Halobacterium sp. KA-4 TaxID=2896367 RepID=UPI001E433066|nr:ParA family protein [Halobacterium sp. KA-4]MCD2200956.1 ParA family protein [Halobacterium sp. KA-4]
MAPPTESVSQTDSNDEAAAEPGSSEPRAVSFAFLKGGTSKTTLSINTARHLAERNGEGSTLFIDLDPNGHATRNYEFGYDNTLYKSGTDLDQVLLGTKDSGPDPATLPVETPFKFDLLPSSNEHESLEKRISSEAAASSRLRTRLVDPLLGDEYDYIIIDQPSNSGMMNNNGVVASGNILMPMLPNGETIESYKRTRERLIMPLEERNMDANILAVIPNRLGARIDQETNDRVLLEAINTNERFKTLVPDFARITEEEWEKIDAGEMEPPKPGVRDTAAITNGIEKEGVPLLDYAPENDQNDHFDEIAAIIERGGV